MGSPAGADEPDPNEGWKPVNAGGLDASAVVLDELIGLKPLLDEVSAGLDVSLVNRLPFVADGAAFENKLDALEDAAGVAALKRFVIDEATDVVEDPNMFFAGEAAAEGVDENKLPLEAGAGLAVEAPNRFFVLEPESPLWPKILWNLLTVLEPPAMPLSFVLFSLSGSSSGVALRLFMPNCGNAACPCIEAACGIA